MTEKQRLFVDSYVKSNDAVSACMQCYSACKSKAMAEKKSNELLNNEEIKKLIEKARAEKNVAEKIRLSDKADAESEDRTEDRSEGSHYKGIAGEEEVMAYLTSVMRGEEKDEITIRTGKDCQEIAQIKPDTKDRMKAAELLAKRYSIGEDKGAMSEVVIREDLE